MSIRLTVTDERRSIDLRTDAPYGPDVLDDIVHRAVLLMLTGTEIEAQQP
jgi:hypothetical protein